MGRKIIPRIRLTSAKDLVEVEAELGNTQKVTASLVELIIAAKKIYLMILIYNLAKCHLFRVEIFSKVFFTRNLFKEIFDIFGSIYYLFYLDSYGLTPV